MRVPGHGVGEGSKLALPFFCPHISALSPAPNMYPACAMGVTVCGSLGWGRAQSWPPALVANFFFSVPSTVLEMCMWVCPVLAETVGGWLGDGWLEVVFASHCPFNLSLQMLLPGVPLTTILSVYLLNLVSISLQHISNYLFLAYCPFNFSKKVKSNKNL